MWRRTWSDIPIGVQTSWHHNHAIQVQHVGGRTEVIGRFYSDVRSCDVDSTTDIRILRRQSFPKSNIIAYLDCFVHVVIKIGWIQLPQNAVQVWCISTYTDSSSKRRMFLLQKCSAVISRWHRSKESKCCSFSTIYGKHAASFLKPKVHRLGNHDSTWINIIGQTTTLGHFTIGRVFGDL